MGGNLFKFGRLPRDEYLEIERELRIYLDARFGDLYRIPRYYANKVDFGDVDVILCEDVTASTSWEEVRDSIVCDLGITDYKIAGPVFSTAFRSFQVDYFLKPSAHFLTRAVFSADFKWGWSVISHTPRGGRDGHRWPPDSSLTRRWKAGWVGQRGNCVRYSY